MTSASHEDVTLNAVTRSKAKKVLATPDIAASPLATWTTRTLIDPGDAGVPVAANYAPKTPASPVDNTAVSEFVLHRQSIARFVRDALQDAVDKQQDNADKRGRKNMATFETGDQVLLSTDGIRSSAVTNLGASKLAPRFIGPFKVMKVNGEAYTLDIPTSLRLHPTGYVGRLKKYYAATIPSTTNPPEPERRASGPHDAQSLPPTGKLPPSHLGLLKRTSYRREPPPPIIDSAGDTRWIVDHIVAHEDPPRAKPRSSPATRGIPAARRYRVRWLGFPPDDDTWKPHSTLLRDVPDVVREYEDEIASENATVADLAMTENASDHAPTEKSPAENERGGPRRD
ncbi:hypothetical protein PR001_g14304 [Phytophthora rubi]|uniref:Chromo domain-containing protein n=1 Tax=Phytophthora rubi TaxID=129364 RepID=A0A6A3LHP1_9STRA|nr:hypothetical protein PR001_g14304 [Phytophthora rubi]